MAHVVSSPISPALSIGSPRTFIIRPNVLVPTGTLIGSLVSDTSKPRFKPSEPPIAIARTTLSPNCC